MNRKCRAQVVAGRGWLRGHRSACARHVGRHESWLKLWGEGHADAAVEAHAFFHRCEIALLRARKASTECLNVACKFLKPRALGALLTLGSLPRELHGL